MSENDALMIYTTFPNLEEAKSVSRQIIMEKYAACANIIPGMTAIYEWQNELEEESEIVVIFKTRKAIRNIIINRLRDLHTYDVPAILVLETDGGNPDFTDWIVKQTQYQ